MSLEIYLSDEDTDILREIGNMGVGKTLSVLRSIIDRKIDVSFSAVEIIDSNKIDSYFPSNQLMIGLHFNISDDLKGMMLFLFKKEDANLLIDILKNTSLGSTIILNELEVNTIKEISSIMAGAYLSTLAQMSDLTLIQSLPHMVFDTSSCIFDFLKGASYDVPYKLFLLKSELTIAGTDYTILGNIILSLPQDQLDKLLTILRKKTNNNQ